MTVAAAIIAIVLAYALGSIPVAYIAGRLHGGLDIREHGSGNVRAANVWQSVSRALVVPVGLAQVAQGLLAILIARAFGQDAAVQAAAGIAAVVAHNWNPWLRFRGGRGVGPAIGILLALSLPALAVFIVIGVAGVLVRRIPEGVLVAIVSMPVTAATAGDGRSTTIGLAALAAVLVAKRLAANGAPDAAASPAVWWNRLLFDRDIRDRDAWVHRAPHADAAALDAPP